MPLYAQTQSLVLWLKTAAHTICKGGGLLSEAPSQECQLSSETHHLDLGFWHRKPKAQGGPSIISGTCTLLAMSSEEHH